MIILGVDPGLNVTGYGLIQTEKNTMIFIDAGFIKTAASSDIQKRLNKIYSELSNLIKRYKPSVLALEKIYSHYRHPATACLLGHVRGIICLLSARQNLALFEYGSTRIKKALLGRGDSSKYQIQRMVQNLLGLKEIPVREDITDALALAIAYTYISRVKL